MDTEKCAARNECHRFYYYFVNLIYSDGHLTDHYLHPEKSSRMNAIGEKQNIYIQLSINKISGELKKKPR